MKNILTQNKTWIVIVCCLIFLLGITFLLIGNDNQNHEYENEYSNEYLPLSAATADLTLIRPTLVLLAVEIAVTCVIGIFRTI